MLLLDLSQRSEITGGLFAATQPVASEMLMSVLDAVNGRWGRATMRREMMSQSLTTRVDELWTVYCK